MKTKQTIKLTAICHLVSALCLPAFAQGTAFTYQGRLQNNGSPASGAYNMTFSLFNINAGGSAVAGPVTTNGVFVTNGLFTVTIDFGSNVFNGTAYWLEVDVETNGAGSFTTLVPRQPLTPTPYSIFAESANAAGLSGTIPAGNVGGTYGNPVNFNNGADSFDGTFSGQFFGSSFIGGDFVGNFIGNGSGLTDVWQTDGNSGTTAGVNFLGTTDNQPLELHVDAVRALRLEPDTTGSGAPNVIGGSPANFMDAGGVIGGFIGGGGALNFNGVGYTNRVSAYFGSIVGGYANWIQSYGNNAFIGGGYFNTVQGASGWSFIGGGQNNTIETNNYLSVIGGGQNNIIGAPWAVIAGGYFNTNAGWVSFIGAGDYNNIQAGTLYSVIGGGFRNTAGGIGVVVGGGGYDGTTFAGNQTYANASVIGGGLGNSIQISAPYSVLGGGEYNSIEALSTNATIAGGNANVIQLNANSAFIGGGQFNNIESYSANATIAGGTGNVIQTNNYASTIGGGLGNQIQSSTDVGAVAGSTIAGGFDNLIQTNAFNGTIAGGAFNLIENQEAVIGGGGYNTNNAYFGTIPGGYENVAAGNYSFAVGNRAQALYSGDFVWADSQGTNFAATTNDQVSFRCQGGVRFTSGSGALNQTVAWTPGSGSWSFPSDRNLKDRFGSVDSASVLDRVSQLPIVEWSYRGYSQRHIGAMAQDFHALFPLNTDDKSLNDADLHGVELAAIQGLDRKLEADARQKDVEIADLKARLEKLEQLVSSKKGDAK
jgi:hypothetical protein